MKPTLLLCLALLLGFSLSAQQPAPADEGRNWGRASHGFQMAASLDATNGIIHCWIRNATAQELEYQGGDIGYSELVDLAVLRSPNLTRIQAGIFPPAHGYYGALPNYLQHVPPGEIITNTAIRMRYKPWPVLTHNQYLKAAAGNTNEARLTEQLNQRMAARGALLAELCSHDTFAFDLIADNLSNLPAGQSLEVRVTQRVFLNSSGEEEFTLVSPPLTLDASLIQACIRQNHELLGK